MPFTLASPSYNPRIIDLDLLQHNSIPQTPSSNSQAGSSTPCPETLYQIFPTPPTAPPDISTLTVDIDAECEHFGWAVFVSVE
jgi:hypothetical protein